MKINYNKAFWSLLVSVSFLLLAGGSLDDDSKGSSKKSCEFANGIEEVKNCLAGTWIATPYGEVWNKVEFDKNGTYRLFQAIPSSGSWKDSPDFTGTYTVEERRYSDSGNKYISVNLNGSGICNYFIAFDGAGATLICGSNYDSIYKNNKNPWN